MAACAVWPQSSSLIVEGAGGEDNRLHVTLTRDNAGDR
jgi:hypothetical protein